MVIFIFSTKISITYKKEIHPLSSSEWSFNQGDQEQLNERWTMEEGL